MLANLARRSSLRANVLQQSTRSMTVKFSKVLPPLPPSSFILPAVMRHRHSHPVRGAHVPFGSPPSQDHEWIKMEGDVGTIGITNHAQDQLGDVVFVDLPEVGSSVEQNDTMGAVESVKAASDIYSPVTGAPALPTRPISL